MPRHVHANIILALSALVVFIAYIVHHAHTHQHMVNEDGIVIPMPPPPTDQCEATQERVAADCKEMMEAIWYDGGAQHYPQWKAEAPSNHVTDYPRCEALASNAFNTCNNWGKQ